MTDVQTSRSAPPRLRTIADLHAVQKRDSLHRYELIDGELFMAPAPHGFHQETSLFIAAELLAWNRRTRLGRVFEAITVHLDPRDEVIPDILWVSKARFARDFTPAGQLDGAPELLVEILSPGGANLRRDRERKLRLYSRYDVEEYWIVTWPMRQIEVYRREGTTLALAITLGADDTLTSPLLPGFAPLVGDLFPPDDDDADAEMGAAAPAAP